MSTGADWQWQVDRRTKQDMSQNTSLWSTWQHCRIARCRNRSRHFCFVLPTFRVDSLSQFVRMYKAERDRNLNKRWSVQVRRIDREGSQLDSNPTGKCFQHCSMSWQGTLNTQS